MDLTRAISESMAESGLDQDVFACRPGSDGESAVVIATFAGAGHIAGALTEAGLSVSVEDSENSETVALRVRR